MPDLQHNPDVLSCLANLSSDEVFTPPEVANAMLDMLPKELWKDSKATFLDPSCKSGVFLREIAKRLIEGLKDEIPDLQTRLDHIFHKQLYGIALTSLTALLSRRSLYGSKWANGKYSFSRFDTADGLVRLGQQSHHTWKNGRCEFCGASQSEYDRDNTLESHAYEFIHTHTPEKIFNMKFDVIIGNPPYQLSDGGFGDSAKSIYNLFIEQAKKLNPKYLVMIIPARWYSGGKGLDDFRNEMLNDKKISILHDFPETSECFPGVNIRGGVCYFLRDRNHIGLCNIHNHKNGQIESSMQRNLLDYNNVFIRYNKGISILEKIKKFNEPTLERKVSSRKPFGIPTNYNSFSTVASDGKSIKMYRNGGYGYISEEDILKGKEYLDKIKVIVAKASPGTDDYPHLVFSEPIIAEKNTVCTETYIIVDTVKNIEQAKNLKTYMASKFFRFLVLLVKNSQDLPKRVYSFVPEQDLNYEWTDDKLFKKYNLSDDEISFINSLVKDVAWR